MRNAFCRTSQDPWAEEVHGQSCINESLTGVVIDSAQDVKALSLKYQSTTAILGVWESDNSCCSPLEFRDIHEPCSLSLHKPLASWEYTDCECTSPQRCLHMILIILLSIICLQKKKQKKNSTSALLRQSQVSQPFASQWTVHTLNCKQDWNVCFWCDQVAAVLELTIVPLQTAVTAVLSLRAG